MLPEQVPWGLKEVLLVHVLRLVTGLILVRGAFPLFFVASPLVIEATDRLLVLALVGLVIHRHGAKWQEWGVSFRHGVQNSLRGLAGGAVLLGISLYSERLYVSVFFAMPAQHPLIVQVQNAATWRDLAVPLFLAALAAPVMEEALYRLLTFPALTARFGLWGGALGSAAIFAFFHFNVYWLAEMMVVGVGLALLYYWTGSLISAVVAHSFINTSKILMLFLGIPLV
ncbi:Abortive infection protein [Thermosinus carboxydivorans Nor1]|uniref:Abortive infection protein n=1 Tax=Thermosinus carboxydivorans Nor1 TaxID=401526 RepID=A1HME3_9FIRM|nr:CPBP family intramembrane glutamic endopeptidase [Thermosinus carboxydivorans]EAX48983.1 Abortive infection protein [Thermosinus carboxydivorans Nor1]